MCVTHVQTLFDPTRFRLDLLCILQGTPQTAKTKGRLPQEEWQLLNQNR